MTARNIVELIEENKWDEVYEEFEAHPEYSQEIYYPSRLGWTKLHWMCSIGSAPASVIDLVARSNPRAITLADIRYGDTCLHIISRNSQTSDEKVRILLKNVVDGNGVLTRNRFGGTALHSAANHNASLGTIKLLVESNPQLLNVTTYEGMHAVSTLFHAYIQTIPGFMGVACLLQGEEMNDAHFERFWCKLEYLATEYYCHKAASPQRLPRKEDDTRYVLHGLLQCHVAINVFKLAILKNPKLATTPDYSGNLPLHRLVEGRPFRLKEREAIEACLHSFPSAVTASNEEGDYPLWMALRNKISWANGIDLLVNAGASVLEKRDPETNLFAFQLAAAVGGKVAVETCFHLLLAHPDLIVRTSA